VMARSLLAAGVSLLLLVGCGSSDLTVSDAAPADTSSAVTVPDAGSPDVLPAPEASVTPDADGTPDAAIADAAVPAVDAPPMVDLGLATDEPVVDAEAADAGMVDAEADAGLALGKLCHELNRGGQPVALTLDFGDPVVTSITAVTGRCAPPMGTPCAVIPAGIVPVRLREGDTVLTSREVVLGAGHEYVFQPIITTQLQVAITGGAVAPGTCSGLDFPPPDGGP
jgi:hypothetical protein